MATYVYRCTNDHLAEYEFGLGTQPRTVRCECGKIGRISLGHGMAIAAAALPNKKQGIRRIEATESQWSKDMPAYRRMRERGLQPPQIDGAAQLEQRVGDQFDIDHADALAHGTRTQVEDTVSSVQEMTKAAS